MSTFSIGGLASGLDTKTIISQLMDIESRPKTQLEWKSQLWAARKSAWSDLNSRLQSLQNYATTLFKPETWNQASAATGASAATSSNFAVAGATVTGTPADGTYVLDVMQLARGEISLSAGNLGAAVAGKRATGAWYKAGPAVVAGTESITSLRTSTGATMGLNTNSTITMNYAVNGVAQQATFKVNTAVNGGQGTKLAQFQAWVGTTIGNGATAGWNAGKLEVTTAPGTANELTGLSFTAVNAANATLGAFNSSVGAATSTTTQAATNGGAVANDTLTINRGGTTWNVAITAGDQKSDIVSKINATSGIGVIASMDGSNIRLQSTTIGAASAFTVTSSGSTAAALGFAETQAAQDAIFSVNGSSSTSASNSNITTAVTGLSLNLTAVGSTNVVVAPGSGTTQSVQEEWIDKTKAKIQDFITQYNSTLDLVYQKTQGESRVVNPKNLGDYLAGPMARDTRYGQVGFDLRSLLSDAVGGLPSGANTLQDIGIKTSFAVGAGGANGKLSIDDAVLENALRTDPDKVKKVLTQSGAGAGITADDGFFRKISERISQLRIGGSVDTAMNGAGTQVSNIQKAIDRATERLERKRLSYEKMYASLENSLGKLQTQGSWLSGQLASLNGGQSQ